MLKLIPVVEFEPGFFKSDDRDNPIVSNNDTFEDWSEYWKNSLADSGIMNITPFQEGSWFVEVSQLTPEIVEILLNKRYRSSVKSSKFYSLVGGYVLEEETSLLSTPSCCGSLIDIKDWERASDWTDKDETMIWIGHPWLMVGSIDFQHLQIRETYEYNEPEEPVIFTVDRSQLKTAIIDANKQLNDFKKVLAITVAKVCPHLADNAIEVAEHLIYS
jgi:hypothetical protein